MDSILHREILLYAGENSKGRIKIALFLEYNLFIVCMGVDGSESIIKLSTLR